jgi:hypothetical protein
MIRTIVTYITIGIGGVGLGVAAKNVLGKNVLINNYFMFILIWQSTMKVVVSQDIQSLIFEFLVSELM